MLFFQNPLALLALLLVPLLLALPFAGRGRRGRGAQFWIALVLRALVLVSLVLGLAGTQLVQRVNNTTVVFVVDHSDSVPSNERARAETFVREAVAGIRAGDRAAVVVFGENALVERLASEETALPPLASVPRTARTNLASALRLALALLPDETNKRIVILSDGLENTGRAEQLIDLARARGVEIDYVPLNPPEGQAEAALDSFQAPAAVRLGQAFEVVAVITSTQPGTATVRLLGDGKLLATQRVVLQQGETRAAFALKAEQAGFRRYTVELDAAQDTLSQNNTAAAFTVVQGPPRVLLVGGADGDNLAAALESANIVVERAAPADVPGDLAALANYDAVYLVNVPAQALPVAALNQLPAYVRDLGRGLVMIGGENAFGAGGYLRTPLEQALPVDMDVRSREQKPNLAIAFVVDKSGSMGQCHCNDPEAQPGSYPRVESGLAKIEIAKSAIMQAARALGRADYVGVVLFDANAHWAARVQPLTSAEDLQEKIGGARAEGQTNIMAGLREAVDALKGVSAKFKHVVLLSDGWSRAGSYDQLVAEMRQENITLSVVAAGAGSAAYLEGLARSAEGKYLAAVTMDEVPELFFQETVRAAGEYLVEEAFQPLPGSVTPILKGLDVAHLPPLYGYNGTTPKATARVSLLTVRGDPLLATWQFGLGRAAVWTSDLKGQWAKDWVSWNGFNTFVAQLTNWVMPQADDPGLQTAFITDGENTTLQVVSTDANGRPREAHATQAQIIAPDGSTQTLTLNHDAPGTYRALLNASTPGVYLAQITQRDTQGSPIASTTTGLVVPYSPEYRSLNSAASVLPALARGTNGRALDDAAQAFAPFPQPAARTQPVWEYLLLAAALLFPLDVAARRLRLGRSDWQCVRARVRRPAPRAATESRVLEGLFGARERARVNRILRLTNAPTNPTTQPSNHPQPPHHPATATPLVAPPTPPPVPGPEEGKTDEDMTTRLKRARDRARQSRS